MIDVDQVKTIDLVHVMHEIDRVMGKTCGACKFSNIQHGLSCRRGKRPLDESDGCGDWEKRHV